MPARSLEHRRIQIQREPLGRTHDHLQEPDPQRPPELLDGTLGKAVEQPAHRVRAGPALQPQQGVQGAIGTSYFCVGEAPRPGKDPDDKRGERVRQGDGVGTGQLPGQMRLHLRGKTALVEEGEEAGQAAEGGDGARRVGEFDFGFPEKRAYNRVHRSVLSCRIGSWFEPILRQFSGTERSLSISVFRVKGFVCSVRNR